MIVGYLVVGIMAGLVAAATALLTGTPWWGALGLYTVVSSLSFLACAGLVALRDWHREAGLHRPHGTAYPAE
jgi:membrane protein implicated in regulation of membrane protease activity